VCPAAWETPDGKVGERDHRAKPNQSAKTVTAPATQDVKKVRFPNPPQRRESLPRAVKDVGEKERSSGLCFTCNQPGHKSEDCLKKCQVKSFVTNLDAAKNNYSFLSKPVGLMILKYE
jgi:hypothetical protein